VQRLEIVPRKSKRHIRQCSEPVTRHSAPRVRHGPDELSVSHIAARGFGIERAPTKLRLRESASPSASVSEAGTFTASLSLGDC